MLKNLSKPLRWLVLLLAVVIVSSLFASLVQNSFWSVKVNKVSFETERGELSGYLYLPRGVDADNPAPAVVLTHGYLNNAEMQLIPAIELSRRGYVVLAFDMYDHGDSTWETPAAFNFFVNSVSDAASFMYDQDYVLKDANGNGMIAVSGHSMGGFSSIWAVLFDEMQAGVSGYRKIAAAMPVGADFRYVSIPNSWEMFGSRSVGFIAAHWDQFFFDNSGTTGSVRYKDFVKDSVGLAFLGQTEAEQGVFYEVAGGQRVIYTPNETHPLNHWSLATGKASITFMEEAFTYQLELHNLGELADYGIRTGSTGQVWWLKEAFTLIALLALVCMIVPLFVMVTKLPVFNKVYKENAAAEATLSLGQDSLSNNVLKALIISITTLIAMFYLTHFMDRSAGLATLADAMYYVIGSAAFFTLAVWVAAIVKSDEKSINLANKATLGAVTVSVIAILYRWLLTNTQIITKAVYWSAPSVNTIAYWAIASAGLILLVVFITTPVFNFGKNIENPYGLKTTFKQLAASLLVAIVMAFSLLLVVALVEWIFLTDFRIYTFAIKIFNSQQFVAALRYMPLLFIYYFAAGVTIFVNTKNCKNWLGDILAAFLLVGPIVVFLIYQYSVLYATGVAAYPSFSLSAILAVGLVPALSIAGIVLRRISLKTGNIWTGVFFTTIFFTFITLANTAVYLLSIA